MAKVLQNLHEYTLGTTTAAIANVAVVVATTILKSTLWLHLLTPSGFDLG